MYGEKKSTERSEPRNLYDRQLRDRNPLPWHYCVKGRR